MGGGLLGAAVGGGEVGGVVVAVDVVAGLWEGVLVRLGDGEVFGWVYSAPGGWVVVHACGGGGALVGVWGGGRWIWCFTS